MSWTLVIIKPDAIDRKLVGQIVARIEVAGFEILSIATCQSDRKLAAHYKEHKGREYYDELIESMVRPLIIMVIRYTYQPSNTVAQMRLLIGPHHNRIVGTIRGDYAIDARHNSIHASDSVEAAEREIGIWFFGEGI